MINGDGRSGLTRITAPARPSVVESQLLAAIESGKFPEGKRLPPERELAESFGVSRVTVRAALQALSALGVIETSQGRGSFVRTAPSTAFRRGFSAWLTTYRKDVVEILEVRGALEELAACHAATRSQAHVADDCHLGQLDRALSHFVAVAGARPSNVDELAAADLNFHAAIAQASGSMLLGALFGDLQEILHDARRAVFALRLPTGRSSVRQHQAIYEAIKSGDATHAGRAMHAHVATTIEFVRNWQAHMDSADADTRQASSSGAYRSPTERSALLERYGPALDAGSPRRGRSSAGAQSMASTDTVAVRAIARDTGDEEG